MNNEVEIFCNNVKLLRKNNSLTQKEMAKICNVGVKSISNIEKGILPKRLSASVLFSLHSHFNISLSALFRPIK